MYLKFYIPKEKLVLLIINFGILNSVKIWLKQDLLG